MELSDLVCDLVCNFMVIWCMSVCLSENGCWSSGGICYCVLFEELGSLLQEVCAVDLKVFRESVRMCQYFWALIQSLHPPFRNRILLLFLSKFWLFI